MTRKNFVGLLTLAVVLSSAATALAVPLRVDFGLSNSPVQAGYTGFGRGTTATNLLAPQSELIGGITVTVAGSSVLADPNQGTGWRNRATVTGTFSSMSALLGDEVKSNGVSSAVGDSLFLTLEGLLAGTYQITTYHHSARTSGSGTIDIYRAGNPLALISDLAQTVGTSPTAIATATLYFLADGINPVTFEYREKAVLGGGAEAVLSGFDLDLIALTPPPAPEPSTLCMLLGSLAALKTRCRRREKA